MGNFFGFGNYEKPGKGVSKDEPVKNRFFLFFELYFRNFWRLIRLNLLWVLACIPIITFGPATTAMMKLVSDTVERKKVYVWHDFWKEFGKNFKGSFFLGIFELLLGFSCIFSIVFFWNNFYRSSLLIYIGFGVAVVFSILFMFTFFYSWLLSAKMALGTGAILKNSFILAVMSIKANLILFLFVLVVLVLGWITFPFSLWVVPFFPMSTLQFLISYHYFPYLYLYVIKPYYEKTGETDPYAPKAEEEEEYEYLYEDENGNLVEATASTEAKQEEALFTDAPQLETGKAASQTHRTGGKSKKIQ